MVRPMIFTGPIQMLSRLISGSKAKAPWLARRKAEVDGVAVTGPTLAGCQCRSPRSRDNR